MSMIVVLVLCMLVSCLAELKILTNLEHLHNNATKLHIRGTGKIFEDGWATAGGIRLTPSTTNVYQSALQGSIIITGSGFVRGMSFTFAPNITAGVDYDMVYISDSKVMLTLRPHKVWRSSPGFVTAKLVYCNGTTYPIEYGGIRVAEVLPNPSIVSSVQYVHESESKIIMISGSGFINVADTQLYIKPTSPDAYKILFVTPTMITIQLKDNHAWLPSHLSLRSRDGNSNVPILVLDIDTGAGQVAYDDPVTVGYVVKDEHTKATGVVYYSSAGIAAIIAAMLILATIFYYYRRYMLSRVTSIVRQSHVISTSKSSKVVYISKPRNSTLPSAPLYEFSTYSSPGKSIDQPTAMQIYESPSVVAGESQFALLSSSV